VSAGTEFSSGGFQPGDPRSLSLTSAFRRKIIRMGAEDQGDDRTAEEKRRVGLCADCSYARRIVSSRGSVFYLCERSASDPVFPKYPRLPVYSCRGYVPDRLRNS
jgi:hypothetical protein